MIYFDALSELAATDVIHGRGAPQLYSEFEVDFEAAYGAPPIAVVAPLAAARRTTTASGHGTVRVRVRAVIIALLEDPLDPSALALLLSRCSADAMRQCLPSLPPGAGTEPTLE